MLILKPTITLDITKNCHNAINLQLKARDLIVGMGKLSPAAGSYEAEIQVNFAFSAQRGIKSSNREIFFHVIFTIRTLPSGTKLNVCGS